MAHYDSVTRLPNRKLLEDTLQQTLSVASMNSKKAVLFIIDLDRFKLISESSDQKISDHLLLEIAQLLESRIQTKDIIT